MLRQRVRATLTAAEADGRLSAALNTHALRPLRSKPHGAGSWEIEVIRNKARDALSRAVSYDDVPSIVRGVDTEALKQRVWSKLAAAAADGRLLDALAANPQQAMGAKPGGAAPEELQALRQRVRATLTAAAVDGRLSAALTIHARRVTDLKRTQATPEEFEVIRSKARVALSRAFSDGSPLGEVEDTKHVELRCRVRTTLIAAAADGRLSAALAASSPQVESRKLQALRSKAFDLLSAAASDGRLSAVLGTTGLHEAKQGLREAPTAAAVDGHLAAASPASSQHIADATTDCSTPLDMEVLRGKARDALSRVFLKQDVPIVREDAGTDALRQRLRTTLATAAADGRLSAAVNASLRQVADASRRASSPEGLATLRKEVFDTLSSAASDGRLHTALEEARVDALKHRLRATLAAATADGRLSSALAVHSPQAVDEMPEDPKPLDMEVLRGKARDALARIFSTQDVSAVIKEARSKALKERVRTVLSASAADGRLSTALAACSPQAVHAKQQGTPPQCLEPIRDRLRTALTRATIEGSLSHILKEVSSKATDEESQGDAPINLEELRCEVRGALLHAAADGRLSSALEETRREAELDAMRQRVQKALTAAAQNGSLAAALVRPQPEPNAKTKSLAPDRFEELRCKAREALAGGACNGRLSTALAEVRLEALRRQVGSKLTAAVSSGTLSGMLAAPPLRAPDAKPQGTPPKDVEELRRQAREALMRAASNGSLPTALEAVGLGAAKQPSRVSSTAAAADGSVASVFIDHPQQAPDVEPHGIPPQELEELRRETREALLRASSNGSLVTALERVRLEGEKQQSQISSTATAEAAIAKPPQGVEEFRRKARETLVDSARNGNMANILKEVRLEALMQRARTSLVAALDEGTLSAAVAACQGLAVDMERQDAKPQGAATQDMEDLRCKAREALSVVFSDDSRTNLVPDDGPRPDVLATSPPQATDSSAASDDCSSATPEPLKAASATATPPSSTSEADGADAAGPAAHECIPAAAAPPTVRTLKSEPEALPLARAKDVAKRSITDPPPAEGRAPKAPAPTSVFRMDSSPAPPGEKRAARDNSLARSYEALGAELHRLDTADAGQSRGSARKSNREAPNAGPRSFDGGAGAAASPLEGVPAPAAPPTPGAQASDTPGPRAFARLRAARAMASAIELGGAGATDARRRQTGGRCDAAKSRVSAMALDLGVESLAGAHGHEDLSSHARSVPLNALQPKGKMMLGKAHPALKSGKLLPALAGLEGCVDSKSRGKTLRSTRSATNLLARPKSVI